jgi:hypothetical protein
MTEFDRTAHMLAALAALTPSEINRITELRVTGGEHFDPMMDEVREAVRAALTPDGDRDGYLTGDKVMEDANIVETYDGARLVQLARVQAAQDYDLAEMPDRHDATSGRLMDVVGYVLDEVYIHGADLLVSHLVDNADRAETEHEGTDDEPDDEPDEDAAGM